MPRDRARLPEGLPAAFSVGQARECGVGRSRLEGSDLERTFHGARMRVGEVGAEAETLWKHRDAAFQRLLTAYLPVMPGHAFLCGTAAARIWGIPLPPWTEIRLEVGVYRPRTAPRRPGVHGRQFTASFVHVVERDGIRMTDPASTWASLGGLLTEDELVVATDRVLRVPRHPGGFQPVTETALATRDQLGNFAERRGRPGAPALRRALDYARTGSASPPETQIRLIIRDAGLPEPVLDHDVYDDHGRFLGCSELAYPELRVAIEYESDGHLTRAQLERDIDKYQAYAEAGWRTVRLTSAHVYRMPREAIRRIRAARRR